MGFSAWIWKIDPARPPKNLKTFRTKSASKTSALALKTYAFAGLNPLKLLTGHLTYNWEEIYLLVTEAQAVMHTALKLK